MVRVMLPSEESLEIEAPRFADGHDEWSDMPPLVRDDQQSQPVFVVLRTSPMMRVSMNADAARLLQTTTMSQIKIIASCSWWGTRTYFGEDVFGEDVGGAGGAGGGGGDDAVHGL
jgi:hypothetical protein